ncbi:MAG TPA: hypothetical protein P5247_01860 [Candidatus Saccharimonadales bacterium]|nr:hypothetical protein [Candidatus Saccharimonadales bacterium]
MMAGRTNQRLHPSKGETVGDFEAFEEHIGMSDVVALQAFRDVLLELYKRTSRVWFPSACGTANWLVKVGNEMRLEGTEFKPVRYGFNHYFALLDIPEAKGLVVDPFGVPEADADWRSEPRLITPFFGEISLAPTEMHSLVYSDTTEGHRTFRP